MDKLSIIEELKAQKERLEPELKALERHLQELQADYHAVAKTLELYETGSLKVGTDQEPKAVRNRSYDLLQVLGNPLHYTDIFKILTIMGTEVGGQEPSKNLIAHLSQDARFKSLGEGKWGLVAWENGTPSMPPPSGIIATVAAVTGHD
jgi:seryl-tRNA synthetase